MFIDTDQNYDKINYEISFCDESEDISHLLYSCPRIKHIWCILSNCLKLNITLKHIILGIPCQNYLSENRNICIVIVSYAIFSTWSKCSWNNSDYKSVKIANIIKEWLSFYGEVFDSSLLNSNQRKSMKNRIKCMLFTSGSRGGVGVGWGGGGGWRWGGGVGCSEGSTPPPPFEK